jgi:8-oxo-dGTP diphosphatase
MLRDRLDSSLMPFNLLPQDGFTIFELQKVHEAILGYSVDKITFRKRVLGRLFCDQCRLVKTGLVERGSHRPAAVYRLGLHRSCQGWRKDASPSPSAKRPRHNGRLKK